MSTRLIEGDATRLPPLGKGRSARVASRVGIKGSRFDLTRMKTARARQLRRDLTSVEMRLWQRLRNKQLGVDFRRQHPAGPYILDFYCPTLRLVIELDGGQHAARAELDRKRDHWLSGRGVTVIWFWNSDVAENFAGVIETIAMKISQLKVREVIPTRRWRADLSFSRGGKSNLRSR